MGQCKSWQSRDGGVRAFGYGLDTEANREPVVAPEHGTIRTNKEMRGQRLSRDYGRSWLEVVAPT